MDNKEALESLEFEVLEEGHCTYIEQELMLAMAALKKQVPVEHHHTMVMQADGEIRISICPSCLCINYTHKDEFPKFCNWCGQAIDWSGMIDEQEV